MNHEKCHLDQQIHFPTHYSFLSFFQIKTKQNKQTNKQKNKQKALCYHQGNQSRVGYSIIVGWSVSPTVTGMSIVKLEIVCALHVGKQKRLYGNGAGLGTINQVWSLLFKLATGVRLIIIEPYSNLFFSVPLIFCQIIAYRGFLT